MDITVSGNIVRVSPGSALLPSGVVLKKTNLSSVTFSTSAQKRVYTLVWQHSHTNVIGGSAESLVLIQGYYTNTDLATTSEDGFISPVDTSLVIGWIRYPGSSVPLNQDHVIQSPRYRSIEELLVPHRLPLFPRYVVGTSDITTVGTGVVELGGIQHTVDWCRADAESDNNAVCTVYQTFAVDLSLPYRMLEFGFHSSIADSSTVRVLTIEVACTNPDNLEKLVLAEPDVIDDSATPVVGLGTLFTRCKVSLTKNPASTFVTVKITFAVPPEKVLSFLYARLTHDFAMTSDYTTEGVIDIQF